MVEKACAFIGQSTGFLAITYVPNEKLRTMESPCDRSSERQFHSIGVVSAQGPFYWYVWWRHQMETFYVLLAFCAGSDAELWFFFDLPLNQQ